VAVKRGDWGLGGEMTQALYAHTNNKIIKKKMWVKACFYVYP
jgi:hypothetical protein